MVKPRDAAKAAKAARQATEVAIQHMMTATTRQEFIDASIKVNLHALEALRHVEVARASAVSAKDERHARQAAREAVSAAELARIAVEAMKAALDLPPSTTH